MKFFRCVYQKILPHSHGKKEGNAAAADSKPLATPGPSGSSGSSDNSQGAKLVSKKLASSTHLVPEGQRNCPQINAAKQRDPKVPPTINSKPSDLELIDPSGQPGLSLWDVAWSTLSKDPDQSEAIAEFQAILTEQFKRNKAQTWNQLIEKELSALKEKQWTLSIGSKSYKLRDMVGFVLGIVSSIKGFLTGVAAIDPVHAGLPVTAVCVILSLISNGQEQSNSLIDGTEHVAKIIQRYVAIEHAYDLSSCQNSLCDCVVDLYKCVMQFEVKAVIHLKKNFLHRGAVNTFISPWGDMITAIDSADNECEKLRKVRDKESHMRFEKLCEQFYCDALQESRSFRALQEQWHESDEATKCMTLLRRFEYEFYKNKNPLPTIGTCNWFPQNPLFRQWLDAPEFACLWMTANPACGKSVLARYLVDELLPKKLSSPQGGLAAYTTICYYFFKADQESAKATNAICTLLHQIFQNPAAEVLRSHLKAAYKADGLKLADLELFEPLWQVFASVISDSCAGRIVAVIDAIDECSQVNDQQARFLQKIQQLAASPDRPKSFKLILTSRPNSDIDNILMDSAQSTAVAHLIADNGPEAQDIQKDIDIYIDDCVEEIRAKRIEKQYNDNAHKAIRKHMYSYPNRNYLWVSLVFKSIWEHIAEPLVNIKKILSITPLDLDKTFESILSRSKDQDEALRLIRLIVAAPEPMTPEDLYIALKIDRGTCKLADLEIPCRNTLREYLRERCGLFIDIIEVSREMPLVEAYLIGGSLPTGAVTLIHESAREFLLKQDDSTVNGSKGLRWKNSISQADASRDYAQSCMLLMLLATHDQSHRGYILWKELFERTGLPTDQIMLHRMAQKYWNSAFANAGEAARCSLDLAIHICESRSSWIGGEADQFETNFSWEDDSGPLFASIAWDLPLVTEALLKDKPSRINAKARQSEFNFDQRGLTPLMFATVNTKTLDNKAEEKKVVNKEACHEVLMRGENLDWEARDDDGHTTLMWAAASGNLLVAQKCLEHLMMPLDLNLTDRRGETAFLQACRSGRRKMVEFLLRQEELDIVCADTSGRNALMSACLAGQREIVSILLSRKCFDLNTRDLGHRSALWLACLAKELAIVDLLLHEKSADINIQDECGRTALMEACRLRESGLVELLLRQSSLKSNAQDSEGFTALMIACQEDATDIVLMLTRQDSLQLNTQDLKGKTALIHACKHNAIGAVRYLLLQPSLDLNVQDHEGSTALMQACRHSNNTTTKALLHDQRLGINIRDKRGRTALHHACLGYNEYCVRPILQQDSLDANSQDLEGRTALMMACEGAEWNYDLMFLLLSSDKVIKDLRDHPQCTGSCKLAKEVIRKILDGSLNPFDTNSEAACPHATGAGYQAFKKYLLRKLERAQIPFHTPGKQRDKFYERFQKDMSRIVYEPEEKRTGETGE